MSILLFIYVILASIGLGFFVGKEWGNKITLKASTLVSSTPKPPKPKEMLKVLRRQPIKSFDERRQESIETGKPIIKVLHK